MNLSKSINELVKEFLAQALENNPTMKEQFDKLVEQQKVEEIFG